MKRWGKMPQRKVKSRRSRGLLVGRPIGRRNSTPIFFTDSFLELRRLTYEIFGPKKTGRRG